MDTYYNILNIEIGATPAEIKKAYFRLVRTYPPDRYPDDFMMIRQAYEVLIDEKTRREYDSVASMPSIVRLYYREAQQSLEIGDPETAISLLEKVVKTHKKYRVVQCLLGDAYLANQNSGKAIKTFKHLVELEPDNAGFVRRLAESYHLRNWYPKAIEHYRSALQLDEDNISLWLGLVESHLALGEYSAAKYTIWQALEVSNRKGWSNIDLYYHIIMIDLAAGEFDRLETHLAEMTRKAEEDELAGSNVAWFLAVLARYIHQLGRHEIVRTLANTAARLAKDDPEIESILSGLSADTAIFHQVELLADDPAISDLLTDTIRFELEKCHDPECMDCLYSQFFYELDIVIEIKNMRREVLRLKNHYPELYSLKKEFFNQVLNRKKEERLNETYRKKLLKLRKMDPQRFKPEDREEELVQPEPSTRSGPKVGRNEPCPCGSGKKYKKCCGR